MSAEVPTRERIMAALDEVTDPELHRSIVALGMVGDVEVRGGDVRVLIKLTVAGCPLKAEIQRRVGEALGPLPGVERVRVELDTMSDEERRRLREGIAGRPERPSPFSRGQRDDGDRRGLGKGRRGEVERHRNLAVALARRGPHVGLLDADVYGYSIPRMMGVTGRPVVVEDLMLPVEAHGVRLMSIGFLTEEDSAGHLARPDAAQGPHQLRDRGLLGRARLPPGGPPAGDGRRGAHHRPAPPGGGDGPRHHPPARRAAGARRAAAMAARVNLRVLGVIENMSWFVAPDTGARYEVFSGGGGAVLAGELGVPLLGQVPLSRPSPSRATPGAGGGGPRRTAPRPARGAAP